MKKKVECNCGGTELRACLRKDCPFATYDWKAEAIRNVKKMMVPVSTWRDGPSIVGNSN